MKCAILGNGPSRKSYNSNYSNYNFVLGCNIPWTKVDATVILDKEIIRYLSTHPELIKFKIYFGVDAWRYTDGIKKRQLFINYFEGLVTPKYPFYSSGHMAIDIVLKLGYSEIDIYGCDSWFLNTLDSNTHQYANTAQTKGAIKCIEAWRARWNKMIVNNPGVKFNFIQ